MTLRAWLWGARARRNARLWRRGLGPVEDLVDEVAGGRSFADVGAIWGVHGKVAFRAEERGATKVTAMDVASPTQEYLGEHSRRDSRVRFVLGDLHDPAVREEAGVHDVVWCSGVLYHCPNPVHTLECLREITGETLVLISSSVPEVPGMPQASVFLPGLGARERREFDRAFDAASGLRGGRAGLTTPFDASLGYGNWWWGLTPSAIAAMLETAGFEVTRRQSDGFSTRIVARAA